MQRILRQARMLALNQPPKNPFHNIIAHNPYIYIVFFTINCFSAAHFEEMSLALVQRIH